MIAAPHGVFIPSFDQCETFSTIRLALVLCLAVIFVLIIGVIRGVPV
jgi:hypothetical protein